MLIKPLKNSSFMQTLFLFIELIKILQANHFEQEFLKHSILQSIDLILMCLEIMVYLGTTQPLCIPKRIHRHSSYSFQISKPILVLCTIQLRHNQSCLVNILSLWPTQNQLVSIIRHLMINLLSVSDLLENFQA